MSLRVRVALGTKRKQKGKIGDPRKQCQDNRLLHRNHLFLSVHYRQLIYWTRADTAKSEDKQTSRKRKELLKRERSGQKIRMCLRARW